MAKVTQKMIKDALRQNRGIVSDAARSLGIARSSLYKRINNNPLLQQALDDEREGLIDFAESKLYDRMDANDTQAITFCLRTIGKDRGWSERQEITFGNNDVFTVGYVDDK